MIRETLIKNLLFDVDPVSFEAVVGSNGSTPSCSCIATPVKAVPSW